MLITSRRPSTELLQIPGAAASSSASATVETAHAHALRKRNNDDSKPKTKHLRYWNRNVGQPLVHLLRSNSYPSDQVRRFKRFFATHVGPALGERLDHRNSQRGSRWTSLMCDDGSPVELGLAWKAKNDSQHAQVRFAIEPVDDDEVRLHRTNLGATHRLINGLVHSGHLSQHAKHLFDRIDRAVSDRLADDAHSNKSRTRYMVGFDLLRPAHLAEPLVQTKAYFVLPGLCSAPTPAEIDEPEAQLASILQSVSDIAPAPGLAQLKAYLRQLPPSQRARPIILSIDLDASTTSTSATRLKVYWRFPDSNPQAIASHMDLGGLWGQNANIGLTAQQAWSTLMAPVSASAAPSSDIDQCQTIKVDPFTSTGGSLFYFDLSWSSLGAGAATKKPAPSKAYVPVRHLAAAAGGAVDSDKSNADLVELEITRRCAEMLEASGRNGAAEAYLDSLVPFCHHSSCGDNLFGSSPVRGVHTYVCAEGRPDKPDVCIYLKPHMYSPRR